MPTLVLSKAPPPSPVPQSGSPSTPAAPTMGSTDPPSAPANSSLTTALPCTSPSLRSFSSSHHRPTGLAPSSPSLPSSEARASHVHCSNPPQPSTCPTATPGDSLPLSSTCNAVPSFPSTSTSSPSSSSLPPPTSAPHGQQHLRPSHSRHSSHPGASRPTKSSIKPSLQHATSGTSAAASTGPPRVSFALPPAHQEPCISKPFAARPRSATSTSALPPSPPPAEDLDDFERRLTQGLADDFAQLALLHEATLLDKMNLARSFTKRLARPTSSDSTPAAKNSRPQISMPMGLISTTNQWVHEVPNISELHVKEIQQRQISSSSSDSSIIGSDSDTSPTSEPPSMTDNSSVESLSPVEPNHLTPYFTSTDRPVSKSPTIVTTLLAEPILESPQESTPTPQPELKAEPKTEADAENESHLIVTPVVPRRAPSHSKREHERLAHARSVSVRSSAISASERLALANHSQHSSLTPETISESASPDSLLPPKSDSRPSSTAQDLSVSSDPFSNELKQLDEVAEEYGSVITTVYTKEEAEDQRVMQDLGLKSFRVSEYLRDIASFRQGLWDLIEEEDEEDDESTPAWL